MTRSAFLASLILVACVLPDVTGREQPARDAGMSSAMVGRVDAGSQASAELSSESADAAANGAASAQAPSAQSSAPAPQASQPPSLAEAASCRPQCAHGVCKSAASGFTCDCAGSGFKGPLCDEPDPCQPDNAGCEQLCVADRGEPHCACQPGSVLQTNGKDCVGWQPGQRLETAYPSALSPRTTFGQDGTVLTFWNAPTKVTISTDANGQRWVYSENFQLAGVRNEVSAGWGPLVTSSAIDSVACVALSRLNPRGEALATHVEVSQDNRRTLIAQRYVAGNWSNPVNVTSLPDSAAISDCVVDVDDQGNGLAVFGTSMGLFAARCAPSGAWGEPSQIAGSMRSDTLALRMQPSGEALLFARDSTELVVASFSPSGGWRSELAKLTTDSQTLRVAMNRSGDALVLWRQQQTLQAATYSRTRGWGRSEQIAELGDFGDRYGHDVAMNANGQAWVVFVKTTHSPLSSIWARPYSATTGWGTAVQISDEFIQAWIDVPGVAIDDAGNAVAGWRRDDFNTVSQALVNRFEANGSWQNQIALSMTAAGYQSSMQVGFNGASTPIAMWTTADPMSRNASVWLSRWK